MKRYVLIMIISLIGSNCFCQSEKNRQKETGEKESGNTRYSEGASGVKRSISYRFVSGKHATGTGRGTFCFDDDNLNSLNYILVDNLDQSGEDQTKWYSTWDDTTGATGRGRITIVEYESDVTVILDVTGVMIKEAGFWKIPVEYISGRMPDDGKIYYYIFSRIAHGKEKNPSSPQKNEKEPQKTAPEPQPVLTEPPQQLTANETQQVLPEEQSLVSEMVTQQTLPAPEPQIIPQQVIPEPEPQIIPQQVTPEPEPQIIPQQVTPEPEPQVLPQQVTPEPEPQVLPQQVTPEPEPQIIPQQVIPEPEPQIIPQQVTPEPEPQIIPQQVTPEPEPQVLPQQVTPEPEPQFASQQVTPEPEPQITGEPEPSLATQPQQVFQESVPMATVPQQPSPEPEQQITEAQPLEPLPEPQIATSQVVVNEPEPQASPAISKPQHTLPVINNNATVSQPAGSDEQKPEGFINVKEDRRKPADKSNSQYQNTEDRLKQVSTIRQPARAPVAEPPGTVLPAQQDVNKSVSQPVSKAPETAAKTDTPAKPSTPAQPKENITSRPIANPASENSSAPPSYQANLQSYSPAASQYNRGRSHGKCYSGIIETGYGPGVGEYGIDNFRFNFINGFHIGPTFTMGLGLGLRRYFPATSLDRYLVSGKIHMPVFLDLRKRFSTRTVTPYLALGIGSSAVFVNDGDTTRTEYEGLLINPSGGIWINISSRFAVFAGVSYELQKLEFEMISDNRRFKQNAGSVCFNIGISF